MKRFATRLAWMLVITMHPALLQPLYAAGLPAPIQCLVHAERTHDPQATTDCFAVDARQFALSTSKLTGNLTGGAQAAGLQQLRMHYGDVFEHRPESRVQVLGVLTLGDLVVVSTRFTQNSAPDRSVDEMTAYSMANGKIARVWPLMSAPSKESPPETLSNDASEIAIVQRYVKAWNDGDVETFLAASDDGAKTYARSNDEDQLGGQPDWNGSSADDRGKYYREVFAKRPHSHVDIVNLLQQQDLVVCHERVTGAAPGRNGEVITVYQVRNGHIRNMWHIARQALE